MAEIENKNALKHGAYSFQAKGEKALTEPNKSRYIELKQQFESQPGREEYRKELAAFIAMMLELGFSDIRTRAEAGRPIWDTPPVARMGSYLNTLVRLMDSWPKDKPQHASIIELLRGDTGDNLDSDQDK